VRLWGAGFGGCLIALADRAASPAIDDAVARYNTNADWPARAESLVASDGAAPIAIR
jgi:galactokinase